jgi:Redoxin
MRKFLLAIVGCAVLTAVILFVTNGGRNAQTATEALATVDVPFLISLDGKEVGLWPMNEGEVAVAIFTQSDCPISNRYAPVVRELCQRFESEDAQFFLVYVDPRETADSVRKHLAEYEYPCAAYRDPDHLFAAFTGATVTPEAVVFDSNWNVVYHGRIDDRFLDFGEARDAAARNDLADAIEAALTGRPVAEPVTKAIGCYIKDLQ